jgi:hypothetical protein
MEHKGMPEPFYKLFQKIFVQLSNFHSIFSRAKDANMISFSKIFIYFHADVPQFLIPDSIGSCYF